MAVGTIETSGYSTVILSGTSTQHYVSGSLDHTTSRQGTSSIILEKWYSTCATVALPPSRALYVEGETHCIMRGVGRENLEQKLLACRVYCDGSAEQMCWIGDAVLRRSALV